MIYVLNTLITPIDFDTIEDVVVKFKRISVQEATNLLRNNEFISAIGHEGTARLLSRLLGIEIKTNRITVYMKRGDVGIHFFLKRRLPEGAVLTEEELKQLDYWLVLSEVC